MAIADATLTFPKRRVQLPMALATAFDAPVIAYRTGKFLPRKHLDQNAVANCDFVALALLVIA